MPVTVSELLQEYKPSRTYAVGAAHWAALNSLVYTGSCSPVGATLAVARPWAERRVQEAAPYIPGGGDKPPPYRHRKPQGRVAKGRPYS